MLVGTCWKKILSAFLLPCMFFQAQEGFHVPVGLKKDFHVPVGLKKGGYELLRFGEKPVK